MIKSKKGFALIYAVMLGILLFFVGLALAPAIHDVTSESMSTSLLNCSSPNVTVFQHATCTQIDLFLPLFIGLIFGLAGFFIGGLL